MDIFALFHTDKNAETAGVLRTIKAGDTSSQLRIARFGNPVFQKHFREIRDSYAQLIEKAKTAEEREALSLEVMIKSTARGILVGWDDGIQYKGEPLPYSVENAEKLLAIPDFYELVFNMSRENEAYLTSKLGDSAKN